MTSIPFPVQMDMRLSAETLADARKAATSDVEWSDPSAVAMRTGALQAHCEILATQLERAHAALAERAK